MRDYIIKMDGNKIFQSFSSPPQQRLPRWQPFCVGDESPLACGPTLPSPQTPLLGRGAAARRRLLCGHRAIFPFGQMVQKRDESRKKGAAGRSRLLCGNRANFTEGTRVERKGLPPEAGYAVKRYYGGDEIRTRPVKWKYLASNRLHKSSSAFRRGGLSYLSLNQPLPFHGVAWRGGEETRYVGQFTTPHSR